MVGTKTILVEVITIFFIGAFCWSGTMELAICRYGLRNLAFIRQGVQNDRPGWR